MAKTLRELAAEKNWKSSDVHAQIISVHGYSAISLDTVRSHLMQRNEPLPAYKKYYCEIFNCDESTIDFSTKERSK